MLIIRVELHSARDGSVREIARAYIANEGNGTAEHADYSAVTVRGRSREALDKQQPQRRGHVVWYPRRALHVWNLVTEALAGMGYGRRRGTIQASEPNALAAVEEAIAGYHLALDRREHNEAAGTAALRRIEESLGMPYQPGEETARRQQIAEAGANA